MRTILLAGLFTLATGAHAQELSYSDFAARCEKKVTVMGRDEGGRVVKVGERMDSFCEGFLQGSFTSLVQAKAVCLKSREWPNAQFLLSLASTYRLEKPDARLGELIAGGFGRYFSCAL